MSQIYDMYRMVKVTRKTARQHEKKEPPLENLVGFQAAHAVTLSVKRDYIKFRPWLTISDASHILADTINAKYVEGMTSRAMIDGQDVLVDTLCVKKKGRKLIEKSWLIFPTGLWSAWYKENGKVFIAFMSALVALLTAIAGLLIKVVLLKKEV